MYYWILKNNTKPSEFLLDFQKQTRTSEFLLELQTSYWKMNIWESLMIFKTCLAFSEIQLQFEQIVQIMKQLIQISDFLLNFQKTTQISDFLLENEYLGMSYWFSKAWSILTNRFRFSFETTIFRNLLLIFKNPGPF